MLEATPDEREEDNEPLAASFRERIKQHSTLQVSRHLVAVFIVCGLWSLTFICIYLK